jgi:hypothetical protein
MLALQSGSVRYAPESTMAAVCVCAAIFVEHDECKLDGTPHFGIVHVL